MKNKLHAALSREEIKARVVEVAREAFHTEGIHNVTMDNIAHRLQMSKRTLYQLFLDKEDLILACIQLTAQRDAERRERNAGVSRSVLDTILLEFNERMRTLWDVRIDHLVDAVKYPRVKAYIEQQQAAERDDAIAFFRLGVEQGSFLPTVDFDIVYDMMLSHFSGVSSQPSLAHRSFGEVFVNTVLVIVRGCATQEGVRQIDEFLAAYKRERLERGLSPLPETPAARA